MLRGEGGQASVEWICLVLLAGALGAGALSVLGPSVDGRSFGGFISHRLVCAVRGGCGDEERALARAYGTERAELVARHAPSIVYEPGERSLPVHYRHCRTTDCAEAPDDRDLDTHRSHAGEPATVFTRVVRRQGRLYLSYWLFYPESNSTLLGSDRVWERSTLLPLIGRLTRGTPDYPGWHLDDWEAYVVRIDPDGSVWARASSHGHWQGCKQSACRGRWQRSSGWTRVSRGSHAGHIPGRWSPPPDQRVRGWRGRPDRFEPRYPGRGLRERHSTADGLRLIPLETLDRRDYRRRDPSVEPPWRKPAWNDPERAGA